MLQREYNLPRDTILWEYSWEDVQFRITELPIERIRSRPAGMKNREYKELCLESLCNRVHQTVDTMKEDYENFQKRLDENKLNREN